MCNLGLFFPSAVPAYIAQTRRQWTPPSNLLLSYNVINILHDQNWMIKRRLELVYSLEIWTSPQPTLAGSLLVLSHGRRTTCREWFLCHTDTTSCKRSSFSHRSIPFSNYIYLIWRSRRYQCMGLKRLPVIITIPQLYKEETILVFIYLLRFCNMRVGSYNGVCSSVLIHWCLRTTQGSFRVNGSMIWKVSSV